MKNKNDRVPFRVLWKNPFWNSVIKFGMWVIFFIVLYLGFFITSSMNRHYNGEEKEKTDIQVSYAQMKKDMLNNNLSIKYKVADYYITGDIKDNILIGTLEDNNDTLIKIKYDGEKVYQLKKEEELVRDDLFKDINISYFIPKNIIEIADNPKNIGIKSNDGLSYNYNVDNVTMTLYMNKKYIEKVIILDNDKTYELEYEVLNES